MSALLAGGGKGPSTQFNKEASSMINQSKPGFGGVPSQSMGGGGPGGSQGMQHLPSN